MKTKKYFYNFYLLRTNKRVNDIRYIGVTVRSLKERFSSHKYEALTRKASRPLYNWWRKRVKEGFKIIIEPIELNFCGNWESREQYWIRHYKQMQFDLLNISDGGAGIVTAEQRNIISRQRSVQAHFKPVIALTKDGTFFKEFSSCTDAAKFFHTAPTSITNACKNRWSKSSNGYIWVFKSEYNPNNVYKYKQKGKGITCYKFNLNGDLISTFDSLDKCSLLEQIDERRILNSMRNKTTINDFIYSTTSKICVSDYTITNTYKIEEYDEFGKLINKYTSYRQFCIQNGLNYSTIFPKLKAKTFKYKNTLKML